MTSTCIPDKYIKETVGDIEDIEKKTLVINWGASRGLCLWYDKITTPMNKIIGTAKENPDVI